MKYLLPCTQCDVEHEIDLAQAGQQFNCECGAKIEVPTMSGIKRLNTAQATAEHSLQGSTWSAKHGAIFVGGILIAIGGVVLLSLGILARSRLVIPDPDAYSNQPDEMLDTLSPLATLELWEDVKEAGIGPYRKPAHIMATNASQRLNWVIASGAIVIAIGVLMLAGAAIAGRRRRT